MTQQKMQQKKLRHDRHISAQRMKKQNRVRPLDMSPTVVGSPMGGGMNGMGMGMGGMGMMGGMGGCPRGMSNSSMLGTHML